jgi:O-acetyl-ADP-ribose deacetylase (regulator of RNase III)
MQFIQGNLLDSPTEALVNTVNTVGVMGKGIALQFKETFPNNYKAYQNACKNKELEIGKLLIFKENTLQGDKWIINFPTKKDWKHKSKIEYIEAGLQDLVKLLEFHQIKSVALPPLGCGNGGLSWIEVQPLIEKYLGELPNTEVWVYEPNEAVKGILQKENLQKEAKLTPSRAILLYSMFYYEILGEDVNLFVANKLAYFLQRLGEKLRLNFVASHYGPYSVQVQHVLYALNGVYLQGLEQNTAKAFEPLRLNYDKFEEIKQYVQKNLSQEQKQRLDNLLVLISGFESALSLEVLASIDFLTQKEKLSLSEITEKLHNWSERKQRLFNAYHIQVAYQHLDNYKQSLDFA